MVLLYSNKTCAMCHNVTLIYVSLELFDLNLSYVPVSFILSCRRLLLELEFYNYVVDSKNCIQFYGTKLFSLGFHIPIFV